MNSRSYFPSKGIRFLIICLFAVSLTGCDTKLRVGTVSGPETKVMKLVKSIALQDYGLRIKLVEFDDYSLLNTALHDGGLDANVFQHQAFLEEELKHTQYALIPLGKTFTYPMGIYSYKSRQLREIKKNAIVGIPDDPTNQTRALRLLEEAGVIKLNIDSGTLVTTESIRYNPKALTFRMINPAKLAASLRKDLDAAVINANYAIQAGLYPREHALFMEKLKSAYTNLIVVREADKNNKELKKLVEACQDEEVVAYAKAVFEGYAISERGGGESGIRTRGRL